MTIETEAVTRTPATQDSDVINQIAGITSESALAQLRAQRPDIVRYAQSSYLALLEPADLGGLSYAERALIALRVATINATPALAAWYTARLHQQGASDTKIAAVEQLSNVPDAAVLSQRELALIAHTDRVATVAVSSTPAHINDLKAAGFGAREIVTLSELIAFVSFQVRALAGLRLLGEQK